MDNLELRLWLSERAKVSKALMNEADAEGNEEGYWFELGNWSAYSTVLWGLEAGNIVFTAQG